MVRDSLLSASFLVFLAAGSAACSAPSSASSTAAASADAGATPPACSADQHRDDTGACDTTIAWAAGPELATPRDHHATFLADPGGEASRFLYVAGGYDEAAGQLRADIVRAPVGDDGALGPWQDAGKLPVPISGAAVVATKTAVLLLGGFQATTTWSAPILPDGALGAWKAGPSLAGVRFHAAAVAHGDFVYVIGGLAGTRTVDDVARARLDADGSLSAFEIVAHLPVTLSHHAAVVDQGTLYVVGGQTGNTNDNSGTPRKNVFIATLGEDGSVGEWSEGPSTPSSYATSSAVAHGGFLYTFGGILFPTADEADGTPTGDVLRTRIAAPGQLEEWTVDHASKLPSAFSHVHHAPVFGSHVYLTSGKDEAGGDAKDVRVGTFQ